MIRNCVSVSAILIRRPHRRIRFVDQQFLRAAWTRNRTFGLQGQVGGLDSAIALTGHNYSSDAGGGSLNGNSSSQDIVNSTAATTEWKRNYYRKITQKIEANITEENNHQKQSTLEPLQIDNYDDVQPMWKEMESRVTRRRSLTLEQRGGMSGRRNVRRSDEDVWLEAGVYNAGTEDVSTRKE